MIAPCGASSLVLDALLQPFSLLSSRAARTFFEIQCGFLQAIYVDDINQQNLKRSAANLFRPFFFGYGVFQASHCETFVLSREETDFTLECKRLLKPGLTEFHRRSPLWHLLTKVQHSPSRSTYFFVRLTCDDLAQCVLPKLCVYSGQAKTLF